MRLFIALDLEELKDILNPLKGSLPEQPSLNLTKDNHLTLKFLGEVEETKLEEIKQQLNTISFPQFQITLDNVGYFPNEEYLKVIWVGITPKDEITKLQEKIEESLKEFNFKKDHKFHPHITLARIRFIKDKQEFKKQIKDIKVKKESITIDNFKLIKSILTPKGPIYEDLETYSIRE
ncbi:MAG: RNA 2',3'-cyclic phosphodiesterase [Nanoarchaeota archaeon]